MPAGMQNLQKRQVREPDLAREHERLASVCACGRWARVKTGMSVRQRLVLLCAGGQEEGGGRAVLHGGHGQRADAGGRAALHVRPRRARGGAARARHAQPGARAPARTCPHMPASMPACGPLLLLCMHALLSCKAEEQDPCSSPERANGRQIRTIPLPPRSLRLPYLPSMRPGEPVLHGAPAACSGGQITAQSANFVLMRARVQTNKTFESFTRHVVRDVWERDFGCAHIPCSKPYHLPAVPACCSPAVQCQRSLYYAASAGGTCRMPHMSWCHSRHTAHEGSVSLHQAWLHPQLHMRVSRT
jgi:hypothetical protein